MGTEPDLHRGDILLFKSDGSCMSDLIAELCDADVSHAAMYYDEVLQLMVEQDMPHVQVNPAPGHPQYAARRGVHVMRHKNASLKMSKVTAAARKYLKEKQPYGTMTLMALGLLLLVKRFAPTKKYIDKVKLILIVLCALLDPGKTCSQFVAQCYRDAGKDYRLKIRREKKAGEESLAGLAQKHLKEQRPGIPPLQELLGAYDKDVVLGGLLCAEGGCPRAVCASGGPGGALPKWERFKPEDLLEVICCALLDIIHSQPPKAAAPEELMSGDFALWCAHFAALAQGVGNPENMTWEELAKLLGNLEDILITPADLLKNCESLAPVTGGLAPSERT